MNPLNIAKELEAIAQAGLHYAKDQFDVERYSRIRNIAADILSENSNLTKDEILNWSKTEFGYATPKVDVRAFIIKEDKILLIREDLDHGRWTLPGGWADVNETPSESVIRETKEESGFDVKVLGLLAVLDREKQGHVPAYPYHIYKHFFHCEITGGKPQKNNESSECDFFAVDNLPELSIQRVLPQQIQNFYKMVKRGKPYETQYD